MGEYKRKPNTECVVCHKLIYRRPSELKRSKKGLYYSQICYGISLRQEKPCLVCGTMILVSAHKKTCSRSCANQHRAGIKYKINRPRDKVHHYLSIKSRLFKQRIEVCERCGYENKKILHIHHKDRDRLNNKLENLEILCPNCHAEEHYLQK